MPPYDRRPCRPRVGTTALVAAAAALLLTGAASGAAPAAPHQLPPARGADANAAGEPHAWILGVAAGRRPRGLDLSRFGAHQLAGLSAYVLPRRHARAAAGQLARAGALTFSEPDGRVVPAQATGPGSLAPHNGWRGYLVAAGLQPPPPGPVLAVIDSQADTSHPAFRGSHISSDSGAPPQDEHGTATVSVAAAADTGLGFEGIYPGANAVNLASTLTCASVSTKVVDAIRIHASVINMSFGSSQPCFLLYLAVMDAVAHDLLPVAAAGNEFLNGNPLSYPASFPHVLTVAAITPSLTPSFFSSRNLGVDVGAPGQGILAAVPAQFDTDGDRDGYQAVSGTSIAAPMVAALADWIRAIRPELSGEQVAAVIRQTAKDIYKPGYDPDTGYGLPQLAPALSRQAPLRPVAEPNDDIPLIDGQFFSRPDPPLWRGTGTAKVVNVLDSFKNPADVFRLSLPAHSRVALRLRVSVGAASLATFPAKAKTTHSRPTAQVRGVKSRARLVLVNRGARRIAYVQVQAASVAGLYQLTISRLG